MKREEESGAPPPPPHWGPSYVVPPGLWDTATDEATWGMSKIFFLGLIIGDKTKAISIAET